MLLFRPKKRTVGLVIHKSDVYVRDFYEVRWPRIRLAIIAVAILSLIGHILCTFRLFGLL